MQGHARAYAMAFGLWALGMTFATNAAEGEQFSPAYLADSANFKAGKDVWVKRCNFCHGKKAYPGKAPKLKPKKYTPAFVYKRVTNGFRSMPSWKGTLTDEERRAVTAFIMHKRFSP
jgi:mono/diheme cytochrome c family protein